MGRFILYGCDESDRINLALDQPRLQPFRTLNPAFALDLR